MCILFHLVVRADYSYFYPGRARGSEARAILPIYGVSVKIYLRKKKKKKKKKHTHTKKQLHIVAEFNFDFDYLITIPRGRTLRLFLGKHVRPATLKTTLSEWTIGWTPFLSVKLWKTPFLAPIERYPFTQIFRTHSSHDPHPPPRIIINVSYRSRLGLDKRPFLWNCFLDSAANIGCCCVGPLTLLGHFGPGQLAYSHRSWASLLGSLPVSYCKNGAP